MRVTVDGKPGTFLGLLAPDYESDMPSAVVRRDDGPGLFLTLHHPSTVTPVPDPADRALRSLVAGVRELQAAWPTIADSDPRLDDLCGFLFATLPLAERVLAAADVVADR